MRAYVLGLAIAACASAPRPRGAIDDDLDAPRPHTDERAFTLAWRGARIGDVRERERTDAGGVRLVRRERIRVRRGGVLTATDVELTVIADRALVASRVEWRELRSDGPPRIRRAVRDSLGWRLEVDDEPPRRAPGDAVPDDLVPILARARGGFRGDVLLADQGFALGHRVVERTGAHAMRATLTVGAVTETADVTLDGDGVPSAIAGSDGVVARRVDSLAGAGAFDPPEVVDTAAIALDRAPPADASAPLALELRGVTRAPPPALPGQRVVANGEAWRVELAAQPAAPAALTALAHDVFAAADGDCTAHALAFAARARAAGFASSIVTGWRVDGARLVRHRWALISLDGRAVAIDPSYGEAPAAPRLVGLAISDDTAAGLAAADLAFAGTDAATARLTASAAPARP